MTATITEELVRKVSSLETDLAKLRATRDLYLTIHTDPNTRTLAADQNDYDIGTYNFVLLLTTAPRNLSGFANGTPGRVLFISNFGSTLTILHNSALSSVGNRILLLSGASRVIPANDGAMFAYMDSAVGFAWRMILPSS